MQSRIRRIAVLLRRESIYQFHLLSGATLAALPSDGWVIREFILEKDGTVPEKLISWKPNGLVCALEGNYQAIESQLSGIRCVYVDTEADGISENAVVLPDLTSHLNAIHEHFAEMGRNDVTLFNLKDSQSPRLNAVLTSAWREFVENRGLEFKCVSVDIDPQHLADPAQLTEVPDPIAGDIVGLKPGAAIFTGSPSLGGYLCRALEVLGTVVPDHVAVLGTDDLKKSLESKPSLSTVALSAKVLGREAVKLLQNILSGQDASDECVVVPCTRLFVRQSSVSGRAGICNINAARAFIEDHACDGISVEDVVRHTQGVSRDTFERRFAATVGERASDLIRKRKLSEARRLLADSVISISTVAAMCGYCDDIYFRKVFKKSENQTPSVYRKQH